MKIIMIIQLVNYLINYLKLSNGIRVILLRNPKYK